MDNTILIAITEIKQGIDSSDSIENRFRTAMIQAKNHWLVVDEDGQLRAAIGAVLVTATEDEKERIHAELDVIKALSAATTGVPVDFDALKMSGNPIGILNLWRELKEKTNGSD